MTIHQTIESYHDAITSMSKSLTTLEQTRDLARARYEEVDARHQALSQAIKVLEDEMALLGHRSLAADGSPTIDLRGCANVGQRLHKIALASGGQIDISNALDIIVGAGVTNAKKQNVRTDIQKWIRRHANDWECITPGTYRYLRFEEGDAGGP